VAGLVKTTVDAEGKLTFSLDRNKLRSVRRREGRYLLRTNQPGYANLSWSSATGEYFSVEYSTNLAKGFTGVLQSNLLATPPTNLVTVPMTNDHSYYRLKF
jgi:hypothetical protein